MKNPLVSVIIPTHNRGQFLDDAIQSALNQSWPHSEIIVVDDGSTDDTRERVLAYGPPVRYLYQPNQGAGAARNTGIAHSRGEYIAFLDDDDIWLPQKLERQVGALVTDPDAVAYCLCAYVDQARNLLPEEPRRIVVNGDVLTRCPEECWVAPSAMMIPRSCIEKAGMFDPSLRACEDWDFCVRLVMAGYTFANIPEVLVHKRLHSTNLGGNLEECLENQFRVLEKLDRVIPPDQWSDENRIRTRSRILISNGVGRIVVGEWESGLGLVIEGLRLRPRLLEDPQFYMSISYGLRPLGYRGPGMGLSALEESLSMVRRMIAEICSRGDIITDPLRIRRAWATFHLVLSWLVGKEHRWDRSFAHLARAAAMDPTSIYRGMRSKLTRLRRAKVPNRSFVKQP